MFEKLQAALHDDDRIAYALVFGSTARGTAHAQSDVDVAVGLVNDERLDALDVGELTARMEAALGGRVDIVLLDEAPPGLAYRVFRDGQPVFVRDAQRLARRRARAVLEYLDFRPLEELFVRGVLTTRHDG